MNEAGKHCPQCDLPLTRVGLHLVCPEHGQIHPGSSRGHEAQTSLHPSSFCLHPLRIFLSYGHDSNEELVRRSNRPRQIQFKDDVEVRKMAELEHGRWVYERFQSGWRYAEKKDASKKLSPYLVPWSRLPDDIKEYDIRAVKCFPEALAESKLEIYR